MFGNLAARPWVRWLTFAARQIIGFVLIVAGAIKLPWPEASVLAVRAYQLLPFDLTRPVGYALPVIADPFRLGKILSAWLRVS